MTAAFSLAYRLRLVKNWRRHSGFVNCLAIALGLLWSKRNEDLRFFR
jgi:hypothetical protein